MSDESTQDRVDRERRAHQRVEHMLGMERLAAITLVYAVRDRLHLLPELECLALVEAVEALVDARTESELAGHNLRATCGPAAEPPPRITEITPKAAAARAAIATAKQREQTAVRAWREAVARVDASPSPAATASEETASDAVYVAIAERIRACAAFEPFRAAYNEIDPLTLDGQIQLARQRSFIASSQVNASVDLLLAEVKARIPFMQEKERGRLLRTVTAHAEERARERAAKAAHLDAIEAPFRAKHPNWPASQ